MCRVDFVLIMVFFSISKRRDSASWTWRVSHKGTYLYAAAKESYCMEDNAENKSIT